MRRNTPISVLRASAVAITVAVLTLAVAGPASADGNSLPDGDALFALSCDPNATPFVVYTVVPETGESTAISDPTSDCAYNSAFDESTGKSYVDLRQMSLAAVDLDTGAVNVVQQFTLEGLPILVNSIAIGRQGAAYALVFDIVYRLDLATGALSDPVTLSTPQFFFSFAFDPATGEFLTMDYAGTLYVLDPAAGTLVLEGTVAVPPDSYNYGLQVDSSGLLWFASSIYGVPIVTTLTSVARDDLATPVPSGTLVSTASDAPYYSFSLLLTRAAPAAPAALADTGFDELPLASGGAAALLLLALGSAAVVRPRRVRA